MKRQLISSGSKLEELASYSRALRYGNQVYLSGTTGYDYATMTISPDAAEQCRQIFRNAEKALAAAGATLREVVRIRIYCPTAEDFEKITPVLGEKFRGIMPASTGVVAALVRPEIRVEIEMEAIIGSAGDGTVA
ncbi:MAG: RidA family protein [Alphaproteobacteria bacterium]|nr:RidA family protein [Alphaproteobacteria bacterium]